MNAAPVRLLLLAGSARAGALSGRLRDAAQRLAQAAGASTSTIDLRALDLPLYDGDLEAAHGVPEGARQLRDAIAAADAVLIVTPEYNGFPTPLAINAFDWLSRVKAAGDGPAGLAATAGQPVALLASSPGPGGGLRAMNFLRQYLQMAFAMLVVPQQFALARAHEAFDETGALKDAKAEQQVAAVVQALLRLARALRTA
jgi:chromate reductase, NAD(P)H dehydrogenase (quinone)